MKRKRAQDTDLPASEIERRRLQRERQRVAYALRSQGTTYVKSSVSKVPDANAKSKRSKTAAGRTRGPSPPFQARMQGILSALLYSFWATYLFAFDRFSHT